MSRLENIDALEKQLADLQMVKSSAAPGKIKKIPPAVPPKKKPQPQVPYSAAVNTVLEPLYSSNISPVCNNNQISSNTSHSARPIYKDYYANVSNLNNMPRTNSNYYGPNSPIPHRNYSPTYSNITPYRKEEKTTPPPPPLPPLNTASSKCYTEEFLPPPSPVSSNYSELVRATTNLHFNQDKPTYPPTYQNDYPDYGTSQASTYESLYEPINPRPHSNISAQINSASPSYQTNLKRSGKSPLAKEEEVDALTNLLVKSITDSQDLDVFGICVKCNEKIVGEGSGCTAMENMYHVKCFSCYHCRVNLQGKPFYAVDGHPYCETDYFETLEKCSVCDNPILDRILRATGKPYHPSCFTCVACGKSLDGIPFTVDAMNQIHCIEDFHRKFAPRCCVCELPIMPEEGEEETLRVVALDRSFHVHCYNCEDCGRNLSSLNQGEGCYPLDGHILCKNCNAHRIRLLTTVMTTDL